MTVNFILWNYLICLVYAFTNQSLSYETYYICIITSPFFEGKVWTKAET